MPLLTAISKHRVGIDWVVGFTPRST